MPMIVNMLGQLTGKEPDRSQSPDEAVAFGAALYAQMLMNQNEGKKKDDDYQLVNVNSHSLGVAGISRKTRTKKNTIVIRKNTPLPVRAERMFHTARADQRTVSVPIVEGESENVDACISIGECQVHDLPAGLPSKTPIRVEFSYAANGRITVSAHVGDTRRSALVGDRSKTAAKPR